MANDKPPGVGWLHYRLAVALCAAVATGLMLLLIPILLAVLGPAAEPLVLYRFVFSKWGAAIVLGASVLGFAVGGERTLSFFSFVWGTHPFWSDLADWLSEHERVSIFLGWTLVTLVVASCWYIFRAP